MTSEHSSKPEDGALIVHDPLAQPHPDPVIESKRRALLRMVQAAKSMKRVDIQLLQMRSPFDNSHPAFAVQTVDEYERHLAASFSGSAHNVDAGRQVFRDIMQGCGFTSCTATPKGSIPQSAKAKLQAVGHEFDQVFVVWDASREWESTHVTTEQAAMAADADPLLLGSIDDVWFCIAKWDLTKLESYFMD